MLDEITQQITLKKRELDTFIEDSAEIARKIQEKKDEFSRVSSELDAQIKALTETKELVLKDVTEGVTKLDKVSTEIIAAEKYKKELLQETAEVLEERNITVEQVGKEIETVKADHQDGLIAANNREEELSKREGALSVKEADLVRREKRIEDYRKSLAEYYGKTFDNYLDH